MTTLTAADLQAALTRGDELVTIPEAAHALGLARTCVYQWVARGALPHHIDHTGQRLVLRDQAAAVEHTTRTQRKTRPRLHG